MKIFCPKILFISLLIFFSCEEESIIDSNCDSFVVSNAEKFANAASASFTIIAASISDNCLHIKYSSSGCSGESWVEEMVDGDVVLESFPPQRNLRMLLENEEACMTVFTREVTFDLSPLQSGDYEEFILNLEGWEEPLVYRYGVAIQEQIRTKWDLLNVSGGFTGVSQDFPKGSIIWDFGETSLEVINNNPYMNALYDGLESGTYPYLIKEKNGYYELTIDEQEFGTIYVSIDTMAISQNVADGFLLLFGKHKNDLSKDN